MPCFFSSCLSRSFGRYSGLVIILEKECLKSTRNSDKTHAGQRRSSPPSSFWRQKYQISYYACAILWSAPQEMKIVSWNVNGLRASIKNSGADLKGLLDRLDADIICFQETKAQSQQKTSFHLTSHYVISPLSSLQGISWTVLCT